MADHEQRVRDLAYQLWEEAGYPDGRSDEFWYLAVERITVSAPAPADGPVEDLPGTTTAPSETAAAETPVDVAPVPDAPIVGELQPEPLPSEATASEDVAPVPLPPVAAANEPASASPVSPDTTASAPTPDTATTRKGQPAPRSARPPAKV